MNKKTVLTVIITLILTFFCSESAKAYESLTYLYGGNTATYIKLEERTRGSLNTVCPDYFEVSTSGEMKYSKSVDPLLLSTMASKSITVTPFLSNHWDRDNARAMLQKRTLVASQLAQAVREHNLDGLDIDIQNITETDKDDFTDFIRLLRNAMPEGTILTVCVPANPYYTTVGWQGGYDYTALSQHCDHIFIMTYDESYPGSEPGPVASFWFIENAIRYAIDKNVPRSKIMIGVPFYGRYWTSSVKGAAFTTADIEWLVANTDSSVIYDESFDCARATVRIPAGTTVTTWGGRIISAGTYDIWYDNARSYEKKLSLVKKYGIRGVGSWALGQETAELWESFSGWLEGHAFWDINKHWAQSYIIKLSEAAILQGNPDGSFMPDGSLTRAQAAAILVRLAGISTANRSHPFTDISGHWAQAEIAAAFETELVTGVEPDKFMPERTITREEFAVMAERYTNIETTFDITQQVFSDVSPNNWSHVAIAKLSINGVISGFPNGEFRPHSPVTRAEAAKIISLVSELPTRFLDGYTLPLDKAHIGPR